jgi:hypothetical protein
MVTHSSTSRPVQCLCMAERTGCPVFTDLWLYVLISCTIVLYSYDMNSALCTHWEYSHAGTPLRLLVESSSSVSVIYGVSSTMSSHW